MKKFYILGTGKDGVGRGEGLYTLIAEDGEFLANHLCSNAGYADSDLWKHRPERQKEWKEKFGEFEVIWLGDDEMKLETLIERNKEWAKKDELAQEKMDKNSAKVEIEVTN